MKIQSPISNLKSRRAFTLVELIVAIALFSILFAIAGGGFVNALRAQRQVASEMAAESNVSIALEEMAREIRTGYLFCHDLSTVGGTATCDTPGDGGSGPPCTFLSSSGGSNFYSCSDLEYYNANGEKIDYVLKNGTLERGDSDVYQPITGNNVTVRSLSFIVSGNTEGDQWNPRITVAVGIAPNDSGVSWNTINFQTTVSARSIDCTTGSPPNC
jgi:prepilin-type N-terminal cleavage/methylation domain-containing protein